MQYQISFCLKGDSISRRNSLCWNFEHRKCQHVKYTPVYSYSSNRPIWRSYKDYPWLIKNSLEENISKHEIGMECHGGECDGAVFRWNLSHIGMSLKAKQ